MSRSHTHDHSHGHGHAPSGASAAGFGTSRPLLLALLLTGSFAGVEALAGWWTGSLALLADAGHMVTDSASLGLARFAAWLGRFRQRLPGDQRWREQLPIPGTHHQ